MSQLHRITPIVPSEDAQTVRLGTNAKQFAAADEGKFVKLSAESAYALCAAGDPIEGVIASVDTAGSGGFSIGSIWKEGTMFATADGAEANLGVGNLVVGDYVVCGTVVALGTPLNGFPKVAKATNQPGTAFAGVTLAIADTAAAVKTVLDAVLAIQADIAHNSLFAWRVVSLGPVGTGVPGTTVVIEPVTP